MSTQIVEPLTGRIAEPCPGHTRVNAQALNSTAQAIAGELFGVDPYAVRVFLRDDAGFLALGINLPLPVAVRADTQNGSFLDRARSQRTLLGQRFTALTGALVSRVDVRVTGVVNPRPRNPHHG